MARAKLTARKHIRALPRRNVVSTESHSDGQHAGYFLSTLQTLLLALGLGFIPNRHKEENKQKIKEPSDPVLVKHKKDPGDAG
jgi:hypothetical protein